MRLSLFLCLTTICLCPTAVMKVWGADSVVEWKSGHEVNTDIAVSPDYTQLVTIGAKNQLRIWAIPGGKLLENVSLPECLPYRVVFAPTGKQLAVSTLSRAGAKVVFIDVRSAKVAREVSLGASMATSMQYSSDGTRLYAGCSSDKAQNSTVEIEVQNGKVRELFKERETDHGKVSTLQRIEVTPNNELLFSSENNGNLQVWSLLDSRALMNLKLSTEELEHISCSPDGRLLAVASKDSRKVSIYDVPTLTRTEIESVTPSKTIHAAAGRINSIMWTSDGEAIALASAEPNHQLELFSVSSGFRVSAPIPLDNADAIVRAIPIQHDQKIAILTKDGVAIRNLSREGLNESYRKLIKGDSQAATIAKQVYDSDKNEIRIEIPKKFADEVLYFLSTNKKARRVRLVGDGVVGYRESIQLDGLSYLSANVQLEDITLSNLRLSNLESLSSIQQLKRLTLAGVSEVDDWKSIRELGSLVELDLSEAAVSNKAIKEISSLTNLKNLRLNSTQFIERRFVSLFSNEGAQYLEQLSNLEHLDLRCWDVNYDSGKIVRNMKQLKYLDLSGTNIHDGCADYLPNLRSLETAKLGHLTSKTLQRIAELPLLTTVAFDGTRINSIDLALLLESKSLTNISVSNFWLPEPVSEFMRRLPNMSADELLAYDCIRLLQQTRNALKTQQSNQEYLMALGVSAPRLGSTGSQNRFTMIDPSIPRHADYLQRVQEFKTTFSLINDATVSLSRKASVIADVARTVCKRAFSEQPQKLQQMEEVIDSFSRK